LLFVKTGGALATPHDYDATDVFFAFQPRRAHDVSLETCKCALHKCEGAGCCDVAAVFDAFMGDEGAQPPASPGSTLWVQRVCWLSEIAPGNGIQKQAKN